MIVHLDQAAMLSSDPPEDEDFELTRLVHTGRQGRPRIEINHDVLETGLHMRGPTHLAPVFRTSARTVRRRALDYGLVDAGAPVYVTYEAEDGLTYRYYTSSSTGPMSDLSDEQLDAITYQIIETFPTFGRTMINGHLRFLGHHVPRSRVRESYWRVHGPPAQSFGARRIERRVYSVPGPNSLWHHDGQHGVCYPHILAIIIETVS
jgi:hypothetical protein